MTTTIDDLLRVEIERDTARRIRETKRNAEQLAVSLGDLVRASTGHRILANQLFHAAFNAIDACCTLRKTCELLDSALDARIKAQGEKDAQQQEAHDA